MTLVGDGRHIPSEMNRGAGAPVAGAADVRVDLQIWPEMIHVWHLFHPELKAGPRAIEEGGAFVQAHIAEKSG